MACVLLAPLMAAAPAAAQERYALVVSGVSGMPTFAERHDTWRTAFVRTLRDRLGFDERCLIVLGETPGAGVRLASQENVREALSRLRKSMTDEDLLLVVLIGHGTFDGIDAKFNLVGPDLEAAEWGALLGGVPGRLVFVNTSSASFPYLEQLAAPGRIVITATDSAAQRFATVFPEFFVQAFDDPAADLDKNGRTSIWEAFLYASTRVRQHYDQRGQLPTERARLDDTGEGVGKEADGSGPGGALAARTYLDAGIEPSATDDPELVDLLRRRASLEAEVEQLKQRKPLLAPGEYERELERVLLDLARVSRAIRQRS